MPTAITTIMSARKKGATLLAAPLLLAAGLGTYAVQDGPAAHASLTSCGSGPSDYQGAFTAESPNGDMASVVLTPTGQGNTGTVTGGEVTTGGTIDQGQYAVTPALHASGIANAHGMITIAFNVSWRGATDDFTLTGEPTCDATGVVREISGTAAVTLDDAKGEHNVFQSFVLDR
jgi:hypothetical protein